MATLTRIYMLKNGETVRLVRAPHPSAALMQIAREWHVKVASQDDLATLLPAGVKVETAADQPRKEQEAQS